MTSTQLLTIKNLKVNVAIPDAHFVAPKDYKITAGTGRPPMSGMPRPGRP
jgi:hypothetical protein